MWIEVSVWLNHMVPREITKEQQEVFDFYTKTFKDSCVLCNLNILIFNWVVWVYKIYVDTNHAPKVSNCITEFTTNIWKCIYGGIIHLKYRWAKKTDRRNLPGFITHISPSLRCFKLPLPFSYFKRLYTTSSINALPIVWCWTSCNMHCIV